MKTHRLELAVLLCLAPLAARADFFNFRNVLPGSRAALLGGAFTAIADDGSAVWYNPAGLSQLPSFTATLAADAYGMHLLDRSLALDSQGTLHTLHFRWFGAIPTTFALTFAPRPGFTLALAAVGADRFRISAHTTTDGIDITDTFFGQSRRFSTLVSKAVVEASTTLVGPAAGLELGAGFSVGLSLFYQLSQVTSSISDTSSNASGDQAQRQHDHEVSAHGLLPVLGVLWKGPAGLRAGFTWGVQTLPIRGTNSYSANVVTTFAGSSLDGGNVAGAALYPHRFALGVAWERPGKLLLSVDVLYYLGMSWAAPHEVLHTERADYAHVEVPHVDASFGTEVWIKSSVTLRAGLFTNTSSASQQNAEERVQMFGFGLGVGIHNGGLSTGLGVVAQFGQSGLQAESAAAVPVAWNRAQVAVVLGGSHRFFDPE
jgi:long-chain fatty acid transport protein